MKGLRFHLVCLIFTTLIITLVPTVVKAYTCVRGLQSGHWTLSGSPYIVQGGIEVPDGETLIIDPGVIVYVAPTTSMAGGFIRVMGGLISDRVTFTGFELENPYDQNDCKGKPKNEPGAWVGISFVSPEPGSMLKNCCILYSGGGSPGLSMCGATGLKDSNLTIEGCLIAYGASDGILLNTGASPIIRNTTIKDHAGYGIIEKYRNCYPVVEGCAINGCGNYAIVNWADNVKNYHDLFIHNNNPDAIRQLLGRHRQCNYRHGAYLR